MDQWNYFFMKFRSYSKTKPFCTDFWLKPKSNERWEKSLKKWKIMDLLVFQKDRNVDKNASKLIWICRQNTERSGLSKTHTSNFLWILNLEINKIASTCANYMILIKLEIQFFIEKTHVYRHVYNRIGCRNVDTRGRVTESSDLTRGSRNLAPKEDSPMRATIHANYTKPSFFF